MVLNINELGKKRRGGCLFRHGYHTHTPPPYLSFIFFAKALGDFQLLYLQVLSSTFHKPFPKHKTHLQLSLTHSPYK